MELLLELRDDLFPEASIPTEIRRAARAVCFDEHGLVPIMRVSRHSYHKLPGGGAEEGESLADALLREIREETGCGIRVLGEVGEIVEFRSAAKFDWIRNLHQTSYCYYAEIISKGVPEFTQDESENGFELEWMPLDRAIATLESDVPDNAEGGFIIRRDLAFLRRVRELRAQEA